MLLYPHQTLTVKLSARRGSARLSGGGRSYLGPAHAACGARQGAGGSGSVAGVGPAPVRRAMFEKITCYLLTCYIAHAAKFRLTSLIRCDSVCSGPPLRKSCATARAATSPAGAGGGIKSYGLVGLT